MRRFTRTCLALAAAAGVVGAPLTTRAQTSGSTASTTTVATPCVATANGTPIVSVSGQIAPERFDANGNDLGISTRPVNLNPNGINFSDCQQNLKLQFRLTACNFTGQNVQIWGSTTTDCTQLSQRVGATAVCWNLGQGSTGLITSASSQFYNVRVQDIVGSQGKTLSTSNYSAQGPSACFAQGTFVAVPINVNFVPVDSAGNLVGQAYQYQITTDLVGPPAPQGVSVSDGDTLLTLNWTSNLDTDTQGYDVAIDPIPGQEPADAASTQTGTAGAVSMEICDSGGAEDAMISDGSLVDGAGDDGSAAVSTPSDAGCRTVQIGNSGSLSPGNAGTCGDTLLTGAILSDGGSSATTVVETDDAGNVIDSGTQSTTGGGIWVPPTGHVLNPNPTTGTTVTGASSSTYTISGLKNFSTYNVVVAAVDGSGNVGPPSQQVCDKPVPVDDFFKTYRLAHGQAGGGFCALEAVGAPASSTVAFAGLAAVVVAQIRRRRGRRSRSK